MALTVCSLPHCSLYASEPFLMTFSHAVLLSGLEECLRSVQVKCWRVFSKVCTEKIAWMVTVYQEKNSPMLPGGSIPPAINEAYWKNVDMKLALPMPVKKGYIVASCADIQQLHSLRSQIWGNISQIWQFV